MSCSAVRAALLLVFVLVQASAAHGQTGAGPPPAPPSPTVGPTAPWKTIFENSQAIYYLDASGLKSVGQYDVTALVEYKVPQVIDGSQVWSVVTRMKLSCDQKQLVTIDNTLRALKMGAGPVVQDLPANDNWHEPQPGSLGNSDLDQILRGVLNPTQAFVSPGAARGRASSPPG